MVYSEFQIKSKEYENKVSMGANLKYTIFPISDAMEMSVEQTFNGEIMHYQREIIELKDKAIRDALMSLGWVPPDKSKQLFNAICSCIEALELTTASVVSGKWNGNIDDDILIVENALDSAREAIYDGT